VQQRELTPQRLAELIQNTPRDELLRRALAARRMARTTATADLVAACEALAAAAPKDRS
jgi:UDP-N-acetylglucosamine--N-acetylmuramyl-(pentapeptide) pyrophosphoryl-undecaprenol N-acetylglucosamine transferase